MLLKMAIIKIKKRSKIQLLIKASKEILTNNLKTDQSQATPDATTTVGKENLNTIPRI